MTFMASNSSLPLIDMAAYRCGTMQERAAVVVDIAARSRDLGFFYLLNHSVPQALMDDQLTWGRRFFAQRTSIKTAIDIRRSPFRRGYEPLALQTLQAGAQPDQKEIFNYGREATGGPPSPFEGPNQWPTEQADFDAQGFRTHLEAYQGEMITLGREISGLIAASLDLPDDYFADALALPSVDVRLLYYPARMSSQLEDEHLLGAGAHTDWGLITILLQDDCGGLEVQTPDGWLKADPISGAFIVNLGDMVVRLTAGRYASNVHRVLNSAPGRDRYSVATFFNPQAHYVVECAPTCTPDEGPPAPVTFADHIHEMVRRTYAA